MTTKFKFQDMTAEDHKYINDILKAEHINVEIENNTVSIESWYESYHNGDSYGECQVEIVLPDWMHAVLNDTTAKQVSKEIAKINSSMQNTLNALIMLNSLLEK